MDVANIMGHLNPDGAPYLQPQAMLRELQNQGYHSTEAAQRVRNIYKAYFNSEVGAVPGKEITSDIVKHSINRCIPDLKVVIIRLIVCWYCHGSLCKSMPLVRLGLTLFLVCCSYLLLRHCINNAPLWFWRLPST